MISSHSIYGHVFSSLVKFIVDFAAAQSSPKPTFINFDAHAVMTSIPDNDVVGIANLAVTSKEKFFTVECGFGVSTTPKNDENLFRQVGLVDRLFARLQPEMKIPLLHSTTGVVLSQMVIVGDTEILPALKGAEIRPAQFIMFSLQPVVTSGPDR